MSFLLTLEVLLEEREVGLVEERETGEESLFDMAADDMDDDDLMVYVAADLAITSSVECVASRRAANEKEEYCVIEDGKSAYVTSVTSAFAGDGRVLSHPMRRGQFEETSSKLRCST